MSQKEITVAKANDLADGEMKAVEAGETKVLLVRKNGKFYALGGTCTHYGAPLAKGVLSEDRVVCPWHHAQFDVTSGEVLEPPALDCLPQYAVRVDGDQVKVTVPEASGSECTPEMAKYDPKADDRKFVIVGAGAAAYAAAQTLREDGFQGRILMITRENRFPYDRPNLSKEYLKGSAEPDWMPLRPEGFFEEHGIELMRNSNVTSIDIPSATVTIENGESITYDKLLIATGGVPKMLPIPGHDLGNVFLLRTYDDCDRIIEAAEKGARAVIIGASFIGMETAASLKDRDVHTVVVAPEATPFETVFGKEVGEVFRKVHEEMGTEFRLGTTVERFEGDGKLEAAVLKNGERIEADFAIVGVGVRPATEPIKGLMLADDGGVIVDEYFSAAEDVYAAGDIAQFPNWRTGVRSRVEHWRTALQGGRQAAHNMAGKHEPYTSIPFFWSRQGDFGITYVGNAREWDEIVIKGDLSERDFLAFYVKNDQVHAVAGVGRPREIDAIHELMRRGKMPPVEDIRGKDLEFVELMK